MFLSILHRMILWELVKVFFLSLVAITGILLMAGIVAEASQHGLGPAQLMEAIPLLIPSTLPYTIPTTTLFACCVVYGRLAHDNEVHIASIRAEHRGGKSLKHPPFTLNIVQPQNLPEVRFHRGCRRPCFRSSCGSRRAEGLGDDVGNQLALELGDEILEDELALLHALNQQRVEGRIGIVNRLVGDDRHTAGSNDGFLLDRNQPDVIGRGSTGLPRGLDEDIERTKDVQRLRIGRHRDRNSLRLCSCFHRFPRRAAGRG